MNQYNNFEINNISNFNKFTNPDYNINSYRFFPVWKRILANCIDYISTLFFLIGLIINTVLYFTRGTTIGLALLGGVIVDPKTNNLPKYSQLIKRVFTKYFGLIAGYYLFYLISFVLFIYLGKYLPLIYINRVYIVWIALLGPFLAFLTFLFLYYYLNKLFWRERDSNTIVIYKIVL